MWLSALVEYEMMECSHLIMIHPRSYVTIAPMSLSAMINECFSVTWNKSLNTKLLPLEERAMLHKVLELSSGDG